MSRWKLACLALAATAVCALPAGAGQRQTSDSPSNLLPTMLAARQAPPLTVPPNSLVRPPVIDTRARSAAATVAELIAIVHAAAEAHRPPFAGPPAVPGRPGNCAGRIATLTGTDGADDLWGTPGRDVIDAGAGDDWIRGLAGDDLICAGDGNDFVFGGAGDDLVYGEGGNDLVEGRAGRRPDRRRPRGVRRRHVLELARRRRRQPRRRDGDRPGTAPTRSPNVEELHGSDYGDTFYGSSGDDGLLGLGGDDLLVGGGRETTACTGVPATTGSSAATGTTG